MHITAGLSTVNDSGNSPSPVTPVSVGSENVRTLQPLSDDVGQQHEIHQALFDAPDHGEKNRSRTVKLHDSARPRDVTRHAQKISTPNKFVKLRLPVSAFHICPNDSTWLFMKSIIFSSRLRNIMPNPAHSFLPKSPLVRTHLLRRPGSPASLYILYRSWTFSSPPAGDQGRICVGTGNVFPSPNTRVKLKHPRTIEDRGQ